MKVLIGIAHPAHVHFYKNFILETNDYNIQTDVIVRKEGLSTKLLDKYEIDYDIVLTMSDSNGMSLIDQMKYEWRSLQKVREIRPDVFTGIGGITAAHVSAVSDTKSVIFTDTEHATVNNKLGFPFADRIYTPDSFQDDIGEKQIRYPSYHELAYLHPNRFTPDPSVLDEAGLDQNDRFVILRQVSWDAVHDIGDSGFEDVVDVVSRLKATGTEVLINSEGDIPNEIQHCKADVPPHKMHDLMYYADLFIGESGTMAMESAVLGTPGIFVSTLRAGVIDDVATNYGLLRLIPEGRNGDQILKRAKDALSKAPSHWKHKREQLIKEKTDTTALMLEQFQSIENHE